MKSRIDWIDALKGIGIFIVVLGHMAISEELSIWIYSFHMPMFFMISGFLFDDKKGVNFRNFIISRTKTILLPWLFFSMISIAFSLCRNLVRPGSSDIKTLIVAFLTGHGVESNLPLWFLEILFVVEAAFFLTSKLKNRIRIAAILTAVFFIRLIFPFSFDVKRAMAAFVFYGIGWMFRDAYFRCRDSIRNLNSAWLGGYYVFLLLWLIIVEVLSMEGKPLNIGYTGTVESILLLATTFLGTICMAATAYRMEQSGFLCWLGKNSIVVLATHILVLDVISVFGSSLLHLDSEWVHQEDNLKALILSVVIMLIEIPIIWVINKWFPFLIGRGKGLRCKGDIGDWNDGRC